MIAVSAIKSSTGEVLTAAAMNALNTFDSPNVVNPRRFGGYKLRGSQLSLSIPAKSIVPLGASISQSEGLPQTYRSRTP